MQDKILIVDDEQEIADLVSLYLTNEGFQVFKFYNALMHGVVFRPRTWIWQSWM